MLYGMRGCGWSASARMLSASFPPAFLRADQPQLCEDRLSTESNMTGLCDQPAVMALGSSYSPASSATWPGLDSVGTRVWDTGHL